MKGDLTVARTEALVEAMLDRQPRARPARKLLVKDLRLFLNSVDRHLETLRQAGFPAAAERTETEEAIILTITLPKQKNRD